MPQIRFLDESAQGKKVAFIIDASKQMWWKPFGELAMTHIKSEFENAFSKLQESLQFNVLLFDGNTLLEFAPDFANASKTKKAELKSWLDEHLNYEVLGLSPESHTYKPKAIYDIKLSGWAQAMQAVLENNADTIFILGDSWGRQDVGREKGQEMLDFSLWELLGGESSDATISESSIFEEDRFARDDSLVNTVEMISNLPWEERDPFMHDLLQYTQFTSDQVLEHLQRLCVDRYLPADQGAPVVSWIRLVDENQMGKIDPASRNMRKMAREFNGNFVNVDGTAIHEKLSRKVEEEILEEEEIEEIVEESSLKFFGIPIESTSIAFVLDVSEKMFTEELGEDTSFDFIKNQIAEMVRELEPKTKLNLFAANETNVVAFAENMATNFSAEDVANWLETIQRGLEEAEGFEVEKNVYASVVGEDVCGLPLAIQVAIEQRAATILVAEADLGEIRVPREKSRRMLDFAILKRLGAREESDDIDLEDDELEGASTAAMLAPLNSDQSQYSSLISQMRDAILDENEKREDEDLPIGFVRNLYDYFEYTPNHLLKHFQTVSYGNCFGAKKRARANVGRTGG